MKKLLLASVLAIASFPGFAHARPFDGRDSMCEKDEECAAECMKVAKTRQEKIDCWRIVSTDPVTDCEEAGDCEKTPKPPNRDGIRSGNAKGIAGKMVRRFRN